MLETTKKAKQLQDKHQWLQDRPRQMQAQKTKLFFQQKARVNADMRLVVQ